MVDDLNPIRLTSDKPRRVVEFAQLQHENKRLREALEGARLILENLPGISIDTRFIDEALREGGGSDGRRQTI